MKVKDLIEELKDFDPDTECYIYADFKKTHIKTDDNGVCFAIIPKTEKDAIFIENYTLVQSRTITEENKDQYTKICIIGH